MSKKEVSRLTKEKNRLTKLLSGIRDMKVLPDIMFVIDPTEEYNAVREARKLGITVVGVCDTNADPDSVDIIIPGNDDAARSVRLFCMSMADAIIEGRDSNKQPEQNIEGNADQAGDDTQSSEQSADAENTSETAGENETENVSDSNNLSADINEKVE
jgi:small subunit ribosomal protein S2